MARWTVRASYVFSLQTSHWTLSAFERVNVLRSESSSHLLLSGRTYVRGNFQGAEVERGSASPAAPTRAPPLQEHFRVLADELRVVARSGLQFTGVDGCTGPAGTRTDDAHE